MHAVADHCSFSNNKFHIIESRTRLCVQLHATYAKTTETIGRQSTTQDLLLHCMVIHVILTFPTYSSYIDYIHVHSVK